MDAIELLRQLRQVEPADPAVLDAALHRLALAARQDACQNACQGRTGRTRWRPGR